MAAYDEHLLRRRCHEHVPRMKLKMEESIGVEKSNSLADIEEIADESGQRHVGTLVPLIVLQPPDVRGPDVSVGEERSAVLGGTDIVKRNEIGVVEAAADTGHMKQPLVVSRAIGPVNNDLPTQKPIEGEPTAMWPVKP
jgi:hypothetical protein